VHRPAAAEGLIAPIRVEGELAEQDAIGGDDADVGAGDEEEHLSVAVRGTHRYMAQLAEVAQGDLAGGIDAVTTNPVMGRGWLGLALRRMWKTTSGVATAQGTVVASLRIFLNR